MQNSLHQSHEVPLHAKYGGRNTVTLIPGDGIGPEMVSAVQDIFRYFVFCCVLLTLFLLKVCHIHITACTCCRKYGNQSHPVSHPCMLKQSCKARYTVHVYVKLLDDKSSCYIINVCPKRVSNVHCMPLSNSNSHMHVYTYFSITLLSSYLRYIGAPVDFEELNLRYIVCKKNVCIIILTFTGTVYQCILSTK